MQPTQNQIQNAIAEVVKRSAQDPEFRARALEEPVASLNEAGGLDLPLNTRIRFADKVEEVVILLPPKGKDDPDEITDEEMLGSVSGGVSPAALAVAAAANLIAALVITSFFQPKK